MANRGKKLFGKKSKRYRFGTKLKNAKLRVKRLKARRRVKKPRKLKLVESRIAKLAKVMRRRRPILISVPSTRLYICRIEKNRFAFMSGEELFPMGLVQSAKRKGRETRILVYPIDTVEHSHMLKALCAP